MTRPSITAGQVHGTAVAFECGEFWAAALLVGRSGSGKSELALELMGVGARLVSDDQVCLHREGGVVYLSAPASIRGLIELRGLGLLSVDPLERAQLTAIVDMNEIETHRLPDPAWQDVQGIAIAHLRKCDSRAFASGLKHYILSQAATPGHKSLS